jgi:hypothetical protein
VASAPGKVLIAGGYLVLERPNAGLVLSTTARFYAVVRPLRDGVAPDSWAWVSYPQPLCFSCSDLLLDYFSSPCVPIRMLDVDGCESDLPSALPRGHIQAVSEEIHGPVDLSKVCF